jgi:hypothetical protein
MLQTSTDHVYQLDSCKHLDVFSRLCDCPAGLQTVRQMMLVVDNDDALCGNTEQSCGGNKLCFPDLSQPSSIASAEAQDRYAVPLPLQVLQCRHEEHTLVIWVSDDKTDAPDRPNLCMGQEGVGMCNEEQSRKSGEQKRDVKQRLQQKRKEHAARSLESWTVAETRRRNLLHDPSTVSDTNLRCEMLRTIQKWAKFTPHSMQRPCVLERDCCSTSGLLHSPLLSPRSLSFSAARRER